MAALSPKRAAWPILPGLQLLHRGKVRDAYDLGGELLLIVTTDAISVFDFVLNALIPDKGYALNAISHFWFVYLEMHGVPTHLVAAGKDIDQYLPKHLWDDPDLQRRAMVVRKLTMLEWTKDTGIEFIMRYALMGSALKEYRASGTVAGIAMDTGMQEGDAFNEPVFDPTTKVESGHDESIPADVVWEKYPDAVALFQRACMLASRLLYDRSIYPADTKGEIGFDKNGQVRVGDEYFTPDCSRFWDLKIWAASRLQQERTAPPPKDKQFVRGFCLEQGINKLDPTNLEHVDLVHQLELPMEIKLETTRLYREVFQQITGKTLEEYARTELGVHC